MTSVLMSRFMLDLREASGGIGSSSDLFTLPTIEFASTSSSSRLSQYNTHPGHSEIMSRLVGE